MTDVEYDVVVIGAGPAGEVGDGRCAEAGMSVVVVESEVWAGSARTGVHAEQEPHCRPEGIEFLRTPWRDPKPNPCARRFIGTLRKIWIGGCSG